MTHPTTLAPLRMPTDPADVIMVSAHFGEIAKNTPLTLIDVYTLNGSIYAATSTTRAARDDAHTIHRCRVGDIHTPGSDTVAAWDGEGVLTEEVGLYHPGMDCTDWTDDDAEADHRAASDTEGL